MADNLLDLALLLEVSKSLAGQAAVDLQTVDKGGNGDEAVGLDFLLESLGGLLLKDDGVLGLVLNCSRVSHAVPYISHPVFSCFNSNTTPPAHSLKQLKEIFAVFDRSEGGRWLITSSDTRWWFAYPFPWTTSCVRGPAWNN